ncbi:phage tail spike protein [Carnobacterium inhibens]|uniref:phage tail spike protein n=1 Tax=Carnobacterium inhibens TaxID=147709 RepID=UPI00203A6FB6|nr:phage tail spike protein [Carnobacterium inhibens]MCM3511636.1 phage tail protein [Carnobacterium inhibens]
MITLYDKLETDFQHNGIGSLDQNIIDPKIHWIDNGVFSFEFEYPLFAKHGLEINNSSIIKARDPEQDNLFFVYKIVPSMGYIKVYAYQMFYKLAFNTINDTNIVNKTGQGALTQMSGGTQYPHKFKFASDILNTANSRVVRKNPVEFLLNSNLDNSFVNRWGGHIIRNGFNISMNQSYGSNKGYTIRHKKDLIGYEAVIDESTVVTRIRPVGYDGLLLPEMFVDSPLINNYPEPRIQEYEYSDVKVGSDEGDFPSNELAYAELRRLAKLEYSQNKIDVPNGVYKIDFVNLKETEEYKNFAPLKQILPGDTVAVKHEEDGVNISAQMVEYNWNPLLKEYIDLTLGSYEKSFTSTVNKLDKIQTDLKDLNNQIELVYLSANGKNQIHTGETEPVINQNSTEGDLWFKKNGDKTEMWILREINSALQWVIELSDATQEELRAELEAVIGQATLDRNKTAQDIRNAVQEANDYAEFLSVKWDEDFNLEVNKINKDINDARTAAIADAKSYTNTKTTELNNYLETVKLDVLSVSTKANDAIIKADKAIADVGFMKIDLTAVTTRANDAFSTAQNSLTEATKALNKATAIETITGTLTTNYDTLTRTVGLKADKEVVNTLNQTVDKHTVDIKANAEGLKVKAEASLVNTIKGTVDNHTAELGIQAQAIDARLTSIQVDNLLSTKKYVNEATLSATSNTWSLALTQVSNDLSNLEIGGRNYYTNTIPIVTNDVSAYLRNTSETSYGFQMTGGSSNLGYVRLDNVLTGKGLWTISFEFRGTQTASVPLTINIAGADSKVVRTTNDNSWSKVSFTANVTNDNLYVLFERIGWAYYRIRNIKVEKGSKATDFTFPPEDMATVEKVSSLELRIDGFQLAINDKVSSAQWTVLSNQVQSKVESATYISKMTQLDREINLRVVQGDVTAAILADKTIKDTRNENQTPYWYIDNYPRQEIREFKIRTVMGVPGNSTYVQVTTKVPWAGGTSGGVPVQIAESNDGTYQRVSSSSGGSWLAWDKVAESGKLVAQINLSTEGVLIQGKVIQLDGQVNMDAAFINKMKAFSIEAVNADIVNISTKILIADVITSVHLKVDNALMDKFTATTAVVNYLFTKTAFVDNLNAKTLTAITANIATIRSQALIANVVDATMLKADVATITKLFATTANVNILTSNSAFITNIKAIDISADKIKTGILNAANVTIINLDASKITSGILTSINITGSKITNPFSITAEGATMTGTTTISGNYTVDYRIPTTGQYGNTLISPVVLSSTNYKSNGTKFWGWELTSQGLSVEYEGRATSYTSSGFTFYPSGGGIPAKVEYIPGNARIAISSYNGVELGAVVGGQHSVRFSVGGGNGVDPFIDAFAPLNMRLNDITNVNMISLVNDLNSKSGSRVFNSTDNWLWMGGKWGTRVGHLSDDGKTVYERAAFGTDNITFFKTLNMNGNSITNQSDSRLKTAIRDTELKALDLIKSYRFVDFLWIDKNKPQGLQTGLIAQETEYLSSVGPDGYLVLDSSKQNMLNTQAIQELSNIVDLSSIRLTKLEKETLDLNNLAAENASQLTHHEKIIKELQEKIKKLESAS